MTRSSVCDFNWLSGGADNDLRSGRAGHRLCDGGDDYLYGSDGGDDPLRPATTRRRGRRRTLLGDAGDDLLSG
jgi:hypothetical protein